MKRIAIILAAAALCAAPLLTNSSEPDETAAARGLPGARPVIDAAKFPSLQAAIDALPAAGGVVQLPAGVFEIREPLRISTGDTTIQGHGAATHIRNLNEQGQPAILLEKPAAAKDKLWRIRLAGFRLTGNAKSGHGIEARQINEIFIHGVTVSHHGGDGIRLDRCYEDPRVCDSLITYNKATGLNLLGCHDIVVAGNQFEENQDALRCTDGFNLCMTGNCLDDHLGRGVVIENTYGSVVSGNMIEECRGAAVVLDRDCYGNTISANVIAHNGKGVLLKDAHGCAVSGNTFTIMEGEALRIGPGSGRITVAGNNFSNSYIGEGAVKRGQKQLTAGGVVLDGTSDIAIAGNVLAGLNPTGLNLTEKSSRRILFDGNLFRRVNSQHDRAEDSLVGDNLHRGEMTAEGRANDEK